MADHDRARPVAREVHQHRSRAEELELRYRSDDHDERCQPLRSVERVDHQVHGRLTLFTDVTGDFITLQSVGVPRGADRPMTSRRSSLAASRLRRADAGCLSIPAHAAAKEADLLDQGGARLRVQGLADQGSHRSGTEVRPGRRTRTSVRGGTTSRTARRRSRSDGRARRRRPSRPRTSSRSKEEPATTAVSDKPPPQSTPVRINRFLALAKHEQSVRRQGSRRPRVRDLHRSERHGPSPRRTPRARDSAATRPTTRSAATGTMTRTTKQDAYEHYLSRSGKSTEHVSPGRVCRPPVQLRRRRQRRTSTIDRQPDGTETARSSELMRSSVEGLSFGGRCDDDRFGRSAS